MSNDETTFRFDRKDWMRRVKAILAQADQASTPEEAAAFTAKATELMAAKQIERAELDAMQAERPEEPIVSQTFKVVKPIIQRGTLLNGIVTNFGGFAVRIGKPKKQKWEEITVFAFESDLAAISVLWASLTVQGERELAQTRIPEGIHPPTFRRAWWSAYAHTVFSRLEAEMTKATAASNVTGVALALRDKKQRVKDEFEMKHGATRRARRVTRRRNEGYSEGAAAGRKVDLGSGTDRLPGGRRSIER